jgi:DNA mismatch repair protein PMS2
MLKILQAYCLVATGVRIICSNQNQKGAKTTLLATTGSSAILDNVISIFGKKQMENLLELQPAIPKEAKYTDAILFDNEDANSSLDISVTDIDKLNLARFEIEGYISSCAHGSGVATRDRQYFYVNSRPCEPKHIIKMVNEIYHRYNVHQQPFVLLNLKIQRSDVDVNLTPDKRQVLVNNEKILLLALKKSLLNTFGAIPGTFKMQNVDISHSFRRLEQSVSPFLLCLSMTFGSQIIFFLFQSQRKQTIHP